MNLLDRYIHEVGRHLPRKNRADIQAELRSLLVDALEDRAGPEPSEAEVAELLKEYGPPKAVAASYHPEGKYLIGPYLYPLFKMATWLTLAGVLGAQLLAWGIALLVGQDLVAPLQILEFLLSGIPSGLAMFFIMYFLLQFYQGRIKEKEWDPKSLLKIDETVAVKRRERIFGIVVGIAILVLLVFFPHWIGFVTFPGGEFFTNQVITQYAGWIIVSIMAGVGLDIYLLWQGQWTTATHIAKAAVNLLSIAILLLLFQGHTSWLADHGGFGLLAALEGLSESTGGGWQIIGMQAFRLAFFVAAIVTIIDTIPMVVRMILRGVRRDEVTISIPIKKT